MSEYVAVNVSFVCGLLGGRSSDRSELPSIHWTTKAIPGSGSSSKTWTTSPWKVVATLTAMAGDGGKNRARSTRHRYDDVSHELVLVSI